MHIRTWHVEVFVYEDESDTTARAILHTESPTHLDGTGSARKSPDDAAVPEIGDEVAVARALSALAEKLLATAAGDIGAIEHRTVTLDMNARQ
jgi:hypothetical protein